MKKYNIDKNNFINYEILNDFVLVNFLFTDNYANLEFQVKHYVDYLRDLNIGKFFAVYPGTPNIIIINTLLNIAHENNLNYRLYYDQQEILDKTNFENTIIKPAHEQISISLETYNKSQSACSGEVGVFCEQNGLKWFGIIFPFSNTIDYVPSPIKYYRISEDGYLVEEYDDNPNDGGNYWKSMRIKEKFATELIKIENGKPKYYAKLAQKV